MSDEVVIDDSNYQDHIEPVIDGERKSHGLIPRDWNKCPHGSLTYARGFDLPLIPENEWQSRLDALIASKGQLSDIRNQGMNGQPIPSRDQDGKGYCWAHSSTSAALIARAVNGEPYEDLSAFAVACIIKNYRDQGGNGADSVDFISKRGIPTSQYWPQQSMSRSNDNPTTWQNAALHKFIRWVDLDPNDMKRQVITCLLLRMPIVTDLDWWGHSIATLDLVSLNPFTTRIWNSWGDSWSSNGTGLLTGNRAIPDNALAIEIMTPSEN